MVAMMTEGGVVNRLPHLLAMILLVEMRFGAAFFRGLPKLAWISPGLRSKYLRNHGRRSFCSKSDFTVETGVTNWQEEVHKMQDSFLDPYYNEVPIRPSTVETANDYPPACDSDLLLPGRHKYLGGAQDARDGCIYGIPSHARSVICLYPSDKEGYQVRTIALPSAVAGGKFKWLRGILAHGYLYGIPAWANSVLQVDIDALWGRRSASGDLVRLIPLPDSHSAGETWQWHGAAINANQTGIYAIPSNADKVLKVDLLTHTTSFIPIDIPAKYSSFQFNHTNKWYGGILGHDNAVYGVPYRTCSVLRIDCETDAATLVGPDYGCQLYNWHGGIQRNGNIYAFPSHASHVLKIDTTELSKGQNCSLLPIHRAPYDSDTVEKYKWLGGGVGEDGNIYGMPCDASSILKIDVETDHCSTFGYVGGEKKKWQGGVLARDGSVYAIPSYGRHVLRIDTRLRSNSTENAFQILGDLPPRKDKWQGAFVGNDGIMYAIPENAYRILRVKPPASVAASDDPMQHEVKIDMM